MGEEDGAGGFGGKAYIFKLDVGRTLTGHGEDEPKLQV